MCSKRIPEQLKSLVLIWNQWNLELSLHIFGYINQNWNCSTEICKEKRFHHNVGNVFNIKNKIIVYCDRSSYLHNWHLLERICTNHPPRLLTRLVVLGPKVRMRTPRWPDERVYPSTTKTSPSSCLSNTF